MVLLARRHGGTALAVLVAAGTLVMIQSLGLSFMWNPWNPLITVFPFGLALLATVVRRLRRPLVPPVSSRPRARSAHRPTSATRPRRRPVHGGRGRARPARATPRLAWDGGALRGLRTPVIVSVALLAVAWAPPLYQQAMAAKGNLSAIWDYFRTGSPTHSLRQCIDIVTAEFTWKPNWLVGNVVVNPFSGEPATLTTTSWPVWWLPLARRCCGPGGRDAGRRGRSASCSSSRSPPPSSRSSAPQGPIYEYRLRFVWLLGMLTAVHDPGSSPSRSPGGPAPPADRWTSVAVGVGARGRGRAQHRRRRGCRLDPTPNTHNGRVVAALSSQVLRHVPRHPGVVLLTVQSVAADRCSPV